MLRCNACWSDVEGKSVVTACQHLFCLKCAQQIVESDSACPVCESVITKSTVKVIQTSQEAAACQLLLCGQPPETALGSALASVQFYVAQQQLQADLRESQLTKKINKVQEACRKKLEEVHNGYVQAKRKYEEAMRTNQQMQQDLQEIQAKFTTKTMQCRKLQEVIKKMQQDTENLRQSSGKIGVLNGPSGSGRSSPTMQPGHLVTTVQRTQVFANMQSPPTNSFGNTVPALMPTSGGRVQGITGGYRPHRQNGGSAGFLGGSLDPNSPGGLLPMNQGLRRSGGNTFGGGGGGQAGGQDNNALRKMLGMPPTQHAMGGGRNGLRDDLFSM
ncbi:hypothetical protein HYH03_002715 [Edaphochlamys debaryana]|uniref:RING-type domain-containing protein n=1 Tax=Edaphochlamys debaryana TaxID=47281 RepID=A0A835YCM8_9CHLO|nr:hypothetical protein HYH03_002715 [Edaphochlamys debaryana]|eukprot:KAG2499132.1 hypothetical protein HYH03_002715 [Edaphochlamys debaryana]